MLQQKRRKEFSSTTMGRSNKHKLTNRKSIIVGSAERRVIARTAAGVTRSPKTSTVVSATGMVIKKSVVLTMSESEIRKARAKQ